MYILIFLLPWIYILYLGISYRIKIEKLEKENSELIDEIIERDCEIKHLNEHIKNS